MLINVNHTVLFHHRNRESLIIILSNHISSYSIQNYDASSSPPSLGANLMTPGAYPLVCDSCARWISTPGEPSPINAGPGMESQKWLTNRKRLHHLLGNGKPMIFGWVPWISPWNLVYDMPPMASPSTPLWSAVGMPYPALPGQEIMSLAGFVQCPCMIYQKNVGRKPRVCNL